MPKPTKINLESTFIPGDSDHSRQRSETVAAKLDLDRRAIEAGRKNEPRPEAIDLDETECALVEEARGFVGATSRVASAKVTEAANAMQAKMPAPFDATLAHAAIDRAINDVWDRHSDPIQKAHAARLASVRSLRSFEETNGLAPFSAKYRDELALFVSLMVLIMIGEGALNAFLFAELQDRGLMGGFLLAISVGLVNVLMGLGCGFLGWRLLLHVRPALRLLGFLITVLLMGGAFALHLALGELREAIGRGGSTAIDFLVILKPWRWFAYTSVAPAVLVAVGIATFVIAALKGRGGGLGVVAPYWGHAELDRQFRDADADLEDATAHLKDALADACDDKREGLHAQHIADRQALSDIRALVNEAIGVGRTLGDSIDAEIGRVKMWMQRYRDRNRAARTAEPPAYFKQFPNFAEWRADRLDFTEVRRLMAEAETIVAENARQLAAFESELLREQVAKLERFRRGLDTAEGLAADRLDKDEASARPRAA